MIFHTISIKARWERWCRWNCDLRVINGRKKAFSVIPKASPWCPNHMTICLLRHSGESLQNGQLKLQRRNWYFAQETHRIQPYQFEPVRQDFERVPEHHVSFEANSMQYSMGFAKSHSLKCSLHRWAWCGAARKSARLNCLNLIHFRASLQVDCAGARALLCLGWSANCYSSRQHSRPA